MKEPKESKSYEATEERMMKRMMKRKGGLRSSGKKRSPVTRRGR